VHFKNGGVLKVKCVMEDARWKKRDPDNFRTILTPYTFYEECLKIAEVVLFPCSSYHRFLAASNIIVRSRDSHETDVHAERMFEKDGYKDNRSCKSRLLRVYLKSNVCFITVNETASAMFSNSTQQLPTSFYSWSLTSSIGGTVITTPSSATPAGLFLIILF